MHAIESFTVQCPYCGELIELMVEYIERDQDYIEDCQVCCKPINIHVHATDKNLPELIVKQENDI